MLTNTCLKIVIKGTTFPPVSFMLLCIIPFDYFERNTHIKSFCTNSGRPNHR